jgi:uncharacterized protein
MDREKALVKAREALLGMVSHERREPGWAYRHGLRTANLSLWLRNKLFPEEKWMDDLLYAAGLFHDCAKDDEEDHAAAGAVRAVDYLEGIAEAKDIPVIEHAIHMHNKRDEPGTDLEKILQDADIIDHFGTIEVWLNVSYSVLGGEGPERSLEFYDHYWNGMIKELREMLNFDLSKAIFDDRIRFNNEFVARLRVESEGGVADYKSIISP